MDYILGVDGGGTKTTAVISDTNGKILAEAVSGGSSYISIGVEKAIKRQTPPSESRHKKQSG